MDHLILYFNFVTSLKEYQLPAINNRKFTLDIADKKRDAFLKIKLEVWDREWYLISDSEFYYTNLNQNRTDERLTAGDAIKGYTGDGNQVVTILVATIDESWVYFQKYCLKKQVLLGKNNGCDIRFTVQFASKDHAAITCENGSYFLSDFSTNGTYLNGERVYGKVKLKVFDEIYIVGTKIVFLQDWLAINNSRETEVTLARAEMETLHEAALAEKMEEADDDYISRAPRIMEPLDREVFELEAPPAAQKMAKQPLLFIIGPSVTMPIPILLSVAFNMSLGGGTVNPMMYGGTFLSVLASAGIGAGWALAHQKYNKKEAKREEENRVACYQAYIDKNSALLEEKHAINKSILERQYVPSNQLAFCDRRYLWNRNIHHEDFLTVRLGRGKVPYPGKILVPKKRFSFIDDVLNEQPQHLFEQYKNMKDSASLISLQDIKILGVIGEQKKMMDLVRSVALQIMMLHCYTDVRLACLYTPKAEDDLSWLRWCPHVFTQDKKLRLMADDRSSWQNVLFYLTNELRNRNDNVKEDDEKKIYPHYIVFCTEKELIEKEAIYSYMVNEKKYGFTFILLYGQLDHLPNECKHIIQSDSAFCGYYRLDTGRDEINAIQFDGLDRETADSAARKISGLYVNETAGGEIPSFIEFMEMLQISRIEQWDLLKHYKENRVYEGIRAQIGVTGANKPMILDLHEKKSGPHGLIAGTTGSGKSETIMTMILSLAMNYHPDEVAFVLIDYKGGGMAQPFLGLPHIAGTITNIDNVESSESLDEAQTQRALVSIKSEIRRRQKLFSEQRVNHIDAYIKLYRSHDAKEPLPHLIIISDEFAELKKEQPGFIKELVSAARVGRSLGIHLILATQKPGGVVDDEIWSNSRFKICLRVQDRQDSLGMLKRVEAAYLTGTGRAYLQIGNDEVFELFQSGYAGAVYEPRDSVALAQDNDVSMIGIDATKRVISQTNRKTNKQGPSQLDACVRYISKITKDQGIEGAKPLWLPPLPKQLSLPELKMQYGRGKKEKFQVIYGLVDQPEIQRQYPALVSFLECAHLLILGDIGMGKTTLLQTLLVSMAEEYSAGEVEFYCCDFSSRTMKMFTELPHCGGVAYEEEREKVMRIFHLMGRILNRRKQLFEKEEVGSFVEYQKVRQLPMVFLIIDNYSRFSEDFADLEESLSTLLKEGVRYGIQVMVAMNNFNEMPGRLRQNINTILPLYLGEKTRYIDALGRVPEILPAAVKGRGLLINAGIVQYQTALAIDAQSEVERNEKLRKLFAALKGKPENQSGAEQIAVIPKDEPYEVFYKKHQKGGRIPLGYLTETVEVEYIGISNLFCYLISSQQLKQQEFFVNNLMYAIHQKNIPVSYVGILDKRDAKKWNLTDVYRLNREDTEKLAITLKESFMVRNQYKKQLLDEEYEGDIRNKIVERFGEYFLMIGNMREFCECIYDTEREVPVYPIFEVVFKRGFGHGIGFFACIESSDYFPVLNTIAGKNFLYYHQGIHLAGKLDQQKLFDFPLPMARLMKPQDKNIGNYMEDGQHKQVFVPLDRLEE